MAGLVLDTHATIWYLEGFPMLSAGALGAASDTNLPPRPAFATR